MMKFVPVSNSDIKPGASLRVKFKNERSKPLVHGKVIDTPVRKIRGDIVFEMDLGDGLNPLKVRHGYYTGTEISVWVDVQERVKQALAARKRWYRAPQPVQVVTLADGPYNGQKWMRDAAHPHSIEFTVGKWRGRYDAVGVWVPSC